LAKHKRSHTPSSFSTSNPHLADTIERNIHTIVDLRRRAAEHRTAQERLADAITAFSGRMSFVYVHIAWFSLWIIANLGLLGIPPFDPFPFGFLTMIVSLEAIFLATFVLISQNRQSIEADRRADLDLQIGLLAEHELTRALKMLDAIQTKLGIEKHTDKELYDLEQEVNPEDVLNEMARVQHEVKHPAKT
jgi:uncharacterized membrane protein